MLWKPKNALAKQYQRLFELEGVKLSFTEDALKAIAEEAARRKSGARGLRAILEEVMLDVMYEIPSLSGVKRMRRHPRRRRVAAPPAARAREEGLVELAERKQPPQASACERSSNRSRALYHFRSVVRVTRSHEDVPMLNPKEKAQIRAVLAEELRRLSKKGESALSYSMNHERNIGRDSIDESMEEELFSTEMRLHDREKFLLGKINKQIVRLDADEIDVCEDCGEAISFRRLLARPVTTLCIECKEQSEREEQATEQAGRAGGFAELGEGGEVEIKAPAEE